MGGRGSGRKRVDDEPRIADMPPAEEDRQPLVTLRMCTCGCPAVRHAEPSSNWGACLKNGCACSKFVDLVPRGIKPPNVIRRPATCDPVSLDEMNRRHVMGVALANLRHLYALMLGGHVTDCAEAARGLLGPAIEGIEGGGR